MAVLPAERLLYLSGRCAAPWPAPRTEAALHTALGRVAGALHTLFLAEAGGLRFHALFRLPPMPALTLRALEAAAGRPVIGSDLSGISEKLAELPGSLTLRAGDAEALVARIAEMAAAPPPEPPLPAGLDGLLAAYAVSPARP